MNNRREGNEEFKNRRAHFIRKIVQGWSNDGAKSSRKSFSPPKNHVYRDNTASKNNIANSIIMRRQLNALNDIAPLQGKANVIFKTIW